MTDDTTTTGTPTPLGGNTEETSISGTVEKASEKSTRFKGSATSENTPETASETTPEAQGDTERPEDRSEAKLRKRAQAAESERDTLASTVTALRQQLATTALSETLAKPSALWEAAGVDVADFFDEAGALDVEAIREAGKAAIREHGLGGFQRFQGGGDGGARGQGIGAEKPDAVATAAKAIRGGR